MIFEKIPDYGDLIPLEEFIEDVKSGTFIDYDGFGEMATENETSGVSIKPSQIHKGYNFPEWCTHILWFNR